MSPALYTKWMAELPQAIASEESPAGIVCDALVVPVFSSDGEPDVVDGVPSLDGFADALRGAGFRGRVGDVSVIPSDGSVAAKVIAVTGLGPRDGVGRSSICSAAAVAAKKLSGFKEIASLLHLGLEDRASAATAAAEGFALGAYRYTDYKTEPQTSSIRSVHHLGVDQGALDLGLVHAEAIWMARDLINEPAMSLTPDALAQKAEKVAHAVGLDHEIMDENALERSGFGGILAVGSGSSNPPRLIRLTYSPEQPIGSIALVGKGVTFDSGGLSLKPAASMELMKTDMAGGAVVLAVMSVLGRLGIRYKVDGYIPTAENMPGGTAMRPGDVIRHYGGRTTEVTNTDAEGRLLLADALAYASESRPDAIVDVATLTTAMKIALGTKSSGLFSNSDRLRQELTDAGEAAGERNWPFPLYDDYLSDLDSDVADHKNSGGRWGGAIIAATFLQKFVAPDVDWAHFDIAGTGRSERDHLEYSRGGTGIPIRTLLEWLASRSK